jgi:hypothetical protein
MPAATGQLRVVQESIHIDHRVVTKEMWIGLQHGTVVGRQERSMLDPSDNDIWTRLVIQSVEAMGNQGIDDQHAIANDWVALVRHRQSNNVEEGHPFHSRVIIVSFGP